MDKITIPKCFKINKVIPGNLVEIKEKFSKISFESMQSEKMRFEKQEVFATYLDICSQC